MGIEELYDKYEHHLLRFARSMTGDSSEAEDLVQDTFLRAMNNMELLDTLADYKVKSWLFKVLKNRLIDKRRSHSLEVLTEFQEYQYELSDHPDMDSGIFIQQVLSHLPDNSREIVYRRYCMDMNSSEIAEVLSIPASTVRYHLRHAIGLLKKEYASI